LCPGLAGTLGPFWPARIGLFVSQQLDAAKAKRTHAITTQNVFLFIIVPSMRATPN
jgi:hypothetical protein